MIIKMGIKIASINLCLGLKNKKDLVKNVLMENKIDVLCMQETEICADFDEDLVQLPGFLLELETNVTKRELACALSQIYLTCGVLNWKEKTPT